MSNSSKSELENFLQRWSAMFMPYFSATAIERVSGGFPI